MTLPAPATNVAKPLKSRIVFVEALPNGRWASRDEGGTIVVWTSEGKSLGTHKIGKEPVGFSDAPSGVAVFEQKSVLVFGNDGKAAKPIAMKREVLRFAFQSSGAIIYEVASSPSEWLRRTPDGKSAKFATFGGKVSFAPLVLADDRVVMVLRETPRQVVVLSPTGDELSRTKIVAQSCRAPQPFINGIDGSFGFAAVDTVHVFGRKHVKAKVSGVLNGWVFGFADGSFAAGTEQGTVEFFDGKGKNIASVRREKVGQGKPGMGIAQATDGTLFAPSTSGTVYRLSATGELLGSAEIGAKLGEKAKALVLDDGTFVTQDDKNVVHLVGLGRFKQGKKLAQAPDLGKQRAELAKHFASWAKTPACKKVLEAVLDRVVSIDGDAKSDLTLGFLTDEQEIYPVSFGAPAKAKRRFEPASLHDVLSLHASVIFDDGVPNEIALDDSGGNFDGELDARYEGLCDAGQNWIMFDTKKRNKLGEPTMILFDHGAGIEDASPFPDQNKLAFGVGGLLLRCLAFRVLGKNRAYQDFGWG